MKFTSLLLLIFLAIQGYTQGIYTETDIAAQDLLIAAKKEVLLGDADKAIDIYKKLLSEHNELAAAYELSRIYVSKEDFDNAQTYAKRAFNGERDNEWYLIQLTDVLAYGGYHLEAAQLFADFTKTEPSNEYHYLQASYHYLKAEQPKDAIRVLDALEKNNGVSEQIVQRKFEILDVMGKEKDALKELEKLHDLYPNEPRYLHNIAGYLRTMGKEGEANKIMDKILKIDPNDETALLFANSSGQNKDANYLRSLVPVMKDDRIDLDKKIIELIPYVQEFADDQNEELGQSLIDITRFLDETYPNNAKVQSILGDIYFYKRDVKSAADYYARSVDSEKSTWIVWAQLFIALDVTEDYERMKKYSEDAIDVYPNQALAYYYNSLSLLELGNLSEAQFSAAEARMVSGNNPNVLKEVFLLESKIKFAEKKFEEALVLVNKSLEITNEDNVRHLDHLGNVHMALNDLVSAKAAWKQAIKAGGNPEVLNKKIKGESDFNN
jgi:tetratricopeptide (TPR) repeat protein